MIELDLELMGGSQSIKNSRTFFVSDVTFMRITHPL